MIGFLLSWTLFYCHLLIEGFLIILLEIRMVLFTCPFPVPLGCFNVFQSTYHHLNNSRFYLLKESKIYFSVLSTRLMPTTHHDVLHTVGAQISFVN